MALLPVKGLNKVAIHKLVWSILSRPTVADPEVQFW